MHEWRHPPPATGGLESLDSSASVTNGGINVEGLSIETTESSRRRLEGRLNGGGAPIRLEGTNGGIHIAAR